MIVRAALVVIFAFLSVQTHSLLHMAEYDFEKHDHNGKVCTYYLHQQLSDSPAIIANAEPPVLNLTHDQAQSFESVLLRTHRSARFNPRAPPVFS